MFDANCWEDYSFALVETLLLLQNFNRPYLLLINKLDLVESGQDLSLSLAEEVLQTERLIKEYPQCCILGFSVMSRSHVSQLRDWLKQMLRLFGELKPSENKAKSTSKKVPFCC